MKSNNNAPAWGIAALVTVFVSSVIVAGPARADDPPPPADSQTPEEILVLGHRARFEANLDPGVVAASIDTASVLKRTPGANVNSNGPLTGIAQYRGLFGHRLQVSVDGTPITSAGPNRMDTPLSYVSSFQVEKLEVHRGIAPVSAGLETLGGLIRVRSRTSEFTSDTSFGTSGNLHAGTSTADNGYAAGLTAAAANDRHRFHVGATAESGGDYEFPGGKVRPSEYERQVYNGGYGFRFGKHELGIDYRHLETGKTGTPALAMDITYIDSDIFTATYAGSYEKTDVTARVHVSDTEHGMSNARLREPPNPAMKRLSEPDGQTVGWSLATTTPVAGGRLGVGTDGDRSRHDQPIVDPTNDSFFVESMNDVERDRYGLWVEWLQPIATGWELELGARYNLVRTDAGDVDTSLGAMAPQALKNAFNEADTSRTDHNFDWVARLAYTPGAHLTAELSAGRKTRSPSRQERYLWLPLAAAGGLADGKNYVGDPQLEPEVSHEVEFGVDWTGALARLAPRVFYRHIDDYIQGTPTTDGPVVMVSTMLGDPNPLRFSNVEAEMYGGDVEASVSLYDGLTASGILSYVRGKRRDISDDLYRIAPLGGLLALGYERERWWLAVEGEFYDAQKRVSRTNEETRSAGYGLLHLRGAVELGWGFTVAAGVDNVLDKRYAPHLGGVNRVVGTDVAVGERLPARGRSFYIAVTETW